MTKAAVFPHENCETTTNRNLERGKNAESVFVRCQLMTESAMTANPVLGDEKSSVSPPRVTADKTGVPLSNRVASSFEIS